MKTSIDTVLDSVPVTKDSEGREARYEAQVSHGPNQGGYTRGFSSKRAAAVFARGECATGFHGGSAAVWPTPRGEIPLFRWVNDGGRTYRIT